jgi:hypothetical protein
MAKENELQECLRQERNEIAYRLYCCQKERDRGLDERLHTVDALNAVTKQQDEIRRALNTALGSTEPSCHIMNLVGAAADALRQLRDEHLSVRATLAPVLAARGFPGYPNRAPITELVAEVGKLAVRTLTAEDAMQQAHERASAAEAKLSALQTLVESSPKSKLATEALLLLKSRR